MGLIQLPKNSHPEFVPSGRKPLSQVSIDWSNPISRGLIGLYSLQNGAYKNLTGTFGDAEAVGAAKYLRDGMYSPGDPSTANYIQSKQNAILPTENSILTTWQCVDASASSFRFFYLRNTYTDYSFYASATGYFLNGTSLGVGLPVDPNVPGQELTIITTNKPALAQGRAYINGNRYEVADGGVLTTAAKLHIGGGSAATSFNSGGITKILAVWGRQLTDAEAYSLSVDPYQILKPSVDNVYYFTGGGGPPPSWLPAWAHRTTKQIGTGVI